MFNSQLSQPHNKLSYKTNDAPNCEVESSGNTNKKSPHPTFSNQLQTGFTLLEIVLVLFLIGLVSSTVFLFTDNIDQQAKYDETKRRMEIIRQAIVGDPTRRLNGQTEISGFVADMGRLPECIAELLELGPEVVSTPPKEYSSPCGGSAANIKQWSVDTNSGIGSGWRGPYIRVSPESNGDYRFRDGYGNSDASDAINSGWVYVTDASGGIALTSMGLDSVEPSIDDVSDSQLVELSDWAVTSIPVTIYNKNSSTALPSNGTGNPPYLSLVIFTSDLSSAIISDNSHDVSTAEISIGDNKSYTFTFPVNTVIPVGNHGYAIVCDSDNAFDSSDNVFDGTGCATSFSIADHMKLFSVAPRQTPILNWTIQ